MIEDLKKLLDNSKSKYYNFRVSAILLTKDGNKFKGVNVETSSPNAGICAERNALYSAISNGYNKEDFFELHIMADKPVTPCFICRQALVDYLNKETKIYIYSLNGLENIYTLDQLTPYSFSEENL
ncbi:MAG: cytidine deaminase [Bacilli bacterium]|nr:cytidine deaminase [Bacilli bacterium]MDD4831705.1 cytidine deaminase [Bacilli bacterium]